MSEQKLLTRRKFAALLTAAGWISPGAAYAQFKLDLGKLQDIGRILKGVSIDEDDEIKIGEEMFAKFIAATGGSYLNRSVQHAVARIAAPIFELSARKKFAWDVHVIDDNEVNAWALPGGKIGVNKGLLRYVNSEDELAAVLAHEAGHAEYSHAAKEMKKKAFYAGLSAAAQTAAVAALKDNRAEVGAGLGTLQIPLFKLVTAGYSRDFEREADSHILEVFGSLGRDVRSGIKMFDTLLEIVPRDSKKTTSLFSGHPDTQKRIEALREAAPPQEGVSVPDSPDFEIVKTAFPTRKYYMRNRA